ncbi:MAG: uroporphyrinogen-III synthase [Gammaproteobacteria bacterium]|jgi:uroporphyrinogen-III synthase
MSGTLNGLHILITRPEHQAQHLCQLLQDQGATVLAFPLINIEPLEDPQRPAQSQYDIIIFVSNNAVTLGIPLIKPLLKNARIATVGKGTARLLEQLEYPADIVPGERFDSEGLLSHPQLQNVTGKSVLIVRGEGGRPLLGDELQKRGANVEYLAAYRRNLPRPGPDNVLQHALKELKLDIILISSGEALDNLLALTSETLMDTLLDTQLAVTHPRQAEKAIKLGFTKPAIISDEPGDEAVLQALIKNR